MAGHNKWSKVKHIKAVQDRKKSALYGKYIKEISIAAKLGGPDPDGNSRLKKAISDAKANNVPRDNIERALKRASGADGDASQLEEIVYEGYGPGGVAILVECVTDNRNRTQPELRKIFEKNGGNIAEAGAVAWGFSKKGSILVSRQNAEEESLMNLALESGAEDIVGSPEGFEITTASTDFHRVLDAIERAGIRVEFSEVGYVPSNRLMLDSDKEQQLRQLLEGLEDQDDVQRVTSNADFE